MWETKRGSIAAKSPIALSAMLAIEKWPIFRRQRRLLAERVVGRGPIQPHAGPRVTAGPSGYFEGILRIRGVAATTNKANAEKYDQCEANHDRPPNQQMQVQHIWAADSFASQYTRNRRTRAPVPSFELYSSLFEVAQIRAVVPSWRHNCRRAAHIEFALELHMGLPSEQIASTNQRTQLTMYFLFDTRDESAHVVNRDSRQELGSPCPGRYAP